MADPALGGPLPSGRSPRIPVLLGARRVVSVVGSVGANWTHDDLLRTGERTPMRRDGTHPHSEAGVAVRLPFAVEPLTQGVGASFGSQHDAQASLPARYTLVRMRKHGQSPDKRSVPTTSSVSVTIACWAELLNFRVSRAHTFTQKSRAVLYAWRLPSVRSSARLSERF